MRKNPPGEQNLLFIFLKALKVYSAGGTTSLSSSAEMLKRVREKIKKGEEKKKEPVKESREGKKREEKEGKNGRIACLLCCSWTAHEITVPCVCQTQSCALGHLFSISSWAIHCKRLVLLTVPYLCTWWICWS